MESKIFGMLLVFALTVAGAGWMFNVTSTNELESKLADAKTGMAGAVANVERLHTNIETSERSSKRITELVGQQKELEQKLEDVQGQIASSKVRAADFAARFDTLVEEIRKNATGKILPEIRLKSGKVLVDAHIQHATADVLSVLYADGTARLLKKDLPDDLVYRFQMMDPVNKPAVVAKPKDPAAAIVAKIKEQKDNLESMNAQIIVAQTNLGLFQKKEYELQSHYASARAAGRSTSIVQLTEVQSAVAANAKKISSLSGQISLAEHEIAKLTDELAALGQH